MTPAPGQTWRPSHGERYGSFCHSALTNSGSSQHAAAVDAAKQRLLDWLFVAAPRVAAAGSSSTPSIGFNQFSATFTMGSACPASEVDDTLTSGTKGLGIDVVGVCRHPGFFDGDDHAIVMGEFFVTNGSTCNGTYRWQQAHDSSNNHAANFSWKTRSLWDDAPDLVGHTVAAAVASCGNGTLDPGEDCDDGNLINGDCCSASCAKEPDGARSCDANDCTRPDSCSNGVCVPGPCGDGQSCSICGGTCEQAGSSCECLF
jgi:cysteine-rich repeat protein